MKKPRLVLAGTGSGVGKTSVTVGLMAALAGRGQNVQPYKVGPDYIDPAFHHFVTGKKSRNLDSWLLDEETVRAIFLKNAPTDGISVIEGVMGLFDGHSREDGGSTAHVAELLEAPVILIIGGSSASRSAAALVHGFNTFKRGFKLSGVIVNQAASRNHYDLVKNFIEKEAGVPCFGFLPKNPAFSLESRHLGLVPSLEVKDLEKRLAILAESVAQTIDLDGLLALAAAAPKIEDQPTSCRPGRAIGEPLPSLRTDAKHLGVQGEALAKHLRVQGEALARVQGEALVRIAVAQDEAFNFYYQDGLDLLTELGAELVPFSPIRDAALPPNVAGLYIGGGFPEVFGRELAANTSLRREILERLNQGLPAYAECGGLMYLGKSLTDFAGQSHDMVGFFHHQTAMTEKLQNFGYVEVEFLADTIIGPAGTKVRAHEFHHSKIIGEEPEYVLDLKKSPARSWRGGVLAKNVLASYPHIHFLSCPALAENFLQACRRGCALDPSDASHPRRS